MRIEMKDQKCEIVTTTEHLEPLRDFFKKNSYTSVLVVSDQHVFAKHGEPFLSLLESFKVNLIEPWIIPSGEQYKSLSTVEIGWSHMQKERMDRKSLLIAFGGGVVTDLSGFAAACFMRGIDCIFIPTTLMGMVDAAIGGKVAINLPTGKNLIGAFHHPRMVLIGAHYLQSLPIREFKSGLAEVIKYGVIWDEKLFEYLEHNMAGILQKEPHLLEHIIQASCKIKAQVVEQDPDEQGIRAYLNWGHTFAHAIETMTNYTQYLHGEAVSIGMNCASWTSKHLNLVDQTFVDRVRKLCHSAGLPTQLPPHTDLDELISLMYADKKAVGGKIHLIVAHKIGKVDLLKKIQVNFIKEALQAMQNATGPVA